MNKNKIIAVALATLTATSFVASTPAFATPKFSNNNYNGSGLEEVATGRTFNYFVINGKVIAKADPIVIGNTTFVSAPDILDALGIEYTTSSVGSAILNVSVNGDEYVFQARSGLNTYYTKNGEKIYNKIVEQNGIKVPENTAKLKYSSGKMFVPLSFFTKELGYSDAFSVDDTWCLNMGEGAGFANTGVTEKTEDFVTGEKTNKNKTIAEGWIRPTLQSVSKDNIVEDAQTLINELEFDSNGSTSAKFNPQDTIGISVGPYAFGSNASHFTNISVEDYMSTNSQSNEKVTQILPQVLKFYFPNSWSKVDELLKAKGKTVRYNIDGRDVVIEGSSGNVYMSKVNGKLQGYLSEFTSQGTIGTAYDVQTSTTGYWTLYGTQFWHYMDANNKFIVGWKQIDNKWYYFDKDGRLQTGWLNDNGTWYYLNSDGTMAFNTTIDRYRLGSNGAWIK